MSASNNPFAWLGLLKWSLAYSDGTRPSDETMTAMSEEDKAFLEAVMKEGIIDENERMKGILKQVTETMEKWKTSKFTKEEEDAMEELLQELRDIVEQIDYARAFAAMKGLVFLLGCAGERERMPKSTRMLCLGILATLSQHNPPVQKELLELGSVKILSDLYFVEDEHSDEDSDGQLRARILQAISANVRSNELAETVFCQVDQAVALLEAGIGKNKNNVPAVVCKRALFFLRALITSDFATRDRVRQFSSCMEHAIDCFLLSQLTATQTSAELTEMALTLTEQVLQQKKSVNAILDRKDALMSLGSQRVDALRNIEGEEKEYAQVELELWLEILPLLESATFDADEPPPAPLMIQDGTAETTMMPQ